MAVLRGLRSRNVGMIYVSHRLDEVFEVADEVAVLRDGRLVGRKLVAATSPRDLVTMIVGRPPEQVFVRSETSGRTVALELRELQIGAVGPVSLTLRAGEMLGLVGLRGAGQEQVGRALFGLADVDAGAVSLCGATPDLENAGCGHACGDRSRRRRSDRREPRHGTQRAREPVPESGRERQAGPRLAPTGRRTASCRKTVRPVRRAARTIRPGRRRPSPAATSRRS